MPSFFDQVDIIADGSDRMTQPEAGASPRRRRKRTGVRRPDLSQFIPEEAPDISGIVSQYAEPGDPVTADDEIEPAADPNALPDKWGVQGANTVAKPSSRYTAEERAAMERGRKLDAGFGIARGALGIIGGLTQALGGQGASAAGGGLAQGVTQSAPPQFEQDARGLAEQRFTQDETQRQAELARQFRERQIDINEENALSGRTNAEANRRMRELAEQRTARLDEQLYDPDSAHADNARRRFMALLETYGARIGDREDWQDVVESLPTVGAAIINENIKDITNAVRENARRVRGRGGAGGGGSARLGEDGSARLGEDGSVRLGEDGKPAGWNNALERVAQVMVLRDAAKPALPGNPLPIEDARLVVAQMTPTQRSDVLRGVVGGVGNTTSEFRERHEEGDHELGTPEWRWNGTTRLSSSDISKARELVAMYENVSRAARRMQQLSQEMTLADFVGARAGVVSERMAEARQLQETISNAMRDIGHYGVPQKSELERMRTFAPELESKDGFLNAARLYGQLRRVLGQAASTRLRSLGYVPANEAGGGR
jgi:hypothetical protein